MGTITAAIQQSILGELQMLRRLITCLLSAIGVLHGATAFAATGPTESPLRVAAMYATSASSAIYVQFQSGAMPGCYANAGGYLYLNHPIFKELYAQLLTMVASGGIQAAVIYTQNTPTNNWGDCTIDGLYLFPQ
jgi:hypothetical protein